MTATPLGRPRPGPADRLLGRPSPPVPADPQPVPVRQPAIRPATTPVAARYPWHRYDLQPRPLREDRILHEIHATGGDIRRICDLFGLSVNAAMRYTAVLEHPHLAADSDRGSGTQGKR